MPAKKKHPSTRARRNKTPGAATLTRRLAAVPDVSLYEDMTLVQLRREIDLRNGERADEQRMTKRGTKAALAGMLALDDIAPARSVPPLPDIRTEGWHDLVARWWDDVWTSPIPDQWDTATDFWNVLFIADLVNDWLRAPTARERREAMAEIRHQRGDLGLSPRARLSLEWIFENADEAKARGNARRSGTTTGAAKQQGKAKRPDPRASLASVN